MQSIASDNLGTILGGLGEVAIDSALDEGVLREIPIIGTIARLLKAGRDLRNEFFLRKVAIFLSKISEASNSERQQFASRFINEAHCRRFGESALLLLEQAESMEKPEIIGRILCAEIRGEIDLLKAMRLAVIIDRCYMVDLEYLSKFENGPQLADPHRRGQARLPPHPRQTRRRRLFAWAEDQLARAALLPSNPLTRALSCALERRTGLSLYLADPEIPIDTNHLERALRPIPMGRKNWLFCWSEIGAEAVATLQSLFVTCRPHDIDPYDYLVDVLQCIDRHPAKEVNLLSPRRWTQHFAANPLR